MGLGCRMVEGSSIEARWLEVVNMVVASGIIGLMRCRTWTPGTPTMFSGVHAYHVIRRSAGGGDD